MLEKYSKDMVPFLGYTYISLSYIYGLLLMKCHRLELSQKWMLPHSIMKWQFQQIEWLFSELKIACFGWQTIIINPGNHFSFLFSILLLWLITVKLKNGRLMLSIIQSRIEKNEKEDGRCFVPLLFCTQLFFLAPFPNSHYFPCVMQCEPSL